jgi:hypothetical protein
VILYYAMGGGLGHLTRARAAVHTLGLSGVTLLTASPLAANPRVVGDLAVVRVPEELAAEPLRYRAFLCEVLSRLRPEAIYLDAFPAGLLGELCDFPFPRGVPLHHLARLLRLREYRQTLSGALPRLSCSYVLEPLLPEHAAWLQEVSEQVQPLSLLDPPQGAAAAQSLPLCLPPGPLWLVVHAGPSAEVKELCAYAAEQARIEGVFPHLVVVAPRPPAAAGPGPPALSTLLPVEQGVRSLHLCDLYPAAPLFPQAERIITACGFNAMRQTQAFAARHRFLPFPRRFDDQFLRAARRASPDRALCALRPA